MAFLTLDAIKDKDDLPRDTVSIDEWGGVIGIIGMTGTLRNNLEQKIANKAQVNDVKMSIITSCCVNEDGSRLFNSSHKKWLAEKNSVPLETLFSAICKLSGIGVDEDDDAEGN